MKPERITEAPGNGLVSFTDEGGAQRQMISTSPSPPSVRHRRGHALQSRATASSSRTSLPRRSFSTSRLWMTRRELVSP